MSSQINISKMSGKLNNFLSINTNNLHIDFCNKMSNMRNKTFKINNKDLSLFNVIFNVCSKPYLEENKIKYNCSKRCFECLKCYNKKTSKKVIIEELKPNFKYESDKKLICNYCYANKNLLTFRKNCGNCYLHNNEVLSDKVLSFDELPNLDKNYAFCRFNSYGELINLIHLENLVNICKKNKKHIFSLYTKKHYLVNQFFKSKKEIPNNLILVYSNPNINNVLRFK